MLAPSVGGDRRPSRGPLGFLVLGATLGGTTLGFAAAVARYFLSPAPTARIGIAIGLGALTVFAIVNPRWRAWIPERACQVRPHHLMPGSMNWVAFRWGIELGLGVCTFIVTPAFYGLIAVSLVQPNPLTAALPMIAYGASRGLTITAFSLSTPSSVEQPIPGLGLERRLRLATILILVTAISLAAGNAIRVAD